MKLDNNYYFFNLNFFLVIFSSLDYEYVASSIILFRNIFIENILMRNKLLSILYYINFDSRKNSCAILSLLKQKKKKYSTNIRVKLILTFLRAIKLLLNDCSAKTLYFFNGGYIDKNFSRNSPEKVGQKRRGKREVLNKCLPRNRKSGWPRGYEIFTRWLVRNFLGGSWSEWVDSQKSLDKTTIVRFDASGIVRYIVRLPIGNGEMCAAKNIVAETCVSFEKLYFRSRIL